jgi:hypothetical protein
MNDIMVPLNNGGTAKGNGYTTFSSYTKKQETDFFFYDKDRELEWPLDRERYIQKYIYQVSPES